jgi:hypothetical protein
MWGLLQGVARQSPFYAKRLRSENSIVKQIFCGDSSSACVEVQESVAKLAVSVHVCRDDD